MSRAALVFCVALTLIACTPILSDGSLFGQDLPDRVGEAFPAAGDPRAAIADALTSAAKENQRVLIVWGGNWCGWSIELARLLTENRALAAEIRNEYRVVRVNIGRLDRHLELAREFGVEIAAGSAPYLTVLAPSTPEDPPTAAEAASRVLENTDGRIFAREDSTDPTALQMWLTSYRAAPLDANEVFRAALREAQREKKRVFLHYSAPW